MADRESKFSGMFEQAEAKPAPSPERIVPKRSEKPEPAKVGRTPGKRSNPEYSQFSVLLKKLTHKRASRALDDLDNGQDLSDLMQQLLEQWLTKQDKKTQ